MAAAAGMITPTGLQPTGHLPTRPQPGHWSTTGAAAMSWECSLSSQVQLTVPFSKRSSLLQLLRRELSCSSEQLVGAALTGEAADFRYRVHPQHHL